MVPLLLFAFAAQRVPLTLLGGLQYLVPIINFLLGWLVYDESMPADRLVGFALVWAALGAVTVDRWRPPRRPGEKSPVCPRRPRIASSRRPNASTEEISMRRYAIPIVAGLAILGVAACSPDEGDFKNDAEGFIEDDDGEVESQVGVALSDASCEDPPSTEEGTTFTLHRGRRRWDDLRLHGRDHRRQRVPGEWRDAGERQHPAGPADGDHRARRRPPAADAHALSW